MFVSFIIYDANALDFPVPVEDGTFVVHDLYDLSDYHLSGDSVYELFRPRGITTDSNNTIYVADSGNSRIRVLESNGTFLHKWGSFGTGDGQFKHPWGISTDSNDNIYVADPYNSRIQVFTPNGTFLHKWGSFGTGDGQFRQPYYITTDSNDNIYVADSGNSRIQVFTPNGTFLHKWGSFGTGNGQFKHPWGLSTDSNDNIYVADPYNSRIQVFTPDGTFLSKWRSWGMANDLFDNGDPIIVAIDDVDEIYVLSNHYGGEIYKYSANGKPIGWWAPDPSLVDHFDHSYPGLCSDPDPYDICMLFDNTHLPHNRPSSYAASDLTVDGNGVAYVIGTHGYILVLSTTPTDVMNTQVTETVYNPANTTNPEAHTIQPTPQTHQNITVPYNPVNTTNPQTSTTLPQERFDLFDWASAILSGFFN